MERIWLRTRPPVGFKKCYFLAAQNQTCSEGEMMIFIVLGAALDLADYKFHTHPTTLVIVTFLKKNFTILLSLFTCFSQHEIQSLSYEQSRAAMVGIGKVAGAGPRDLLHIGTPSAEQSTPQNTAGNLLWVGRSASFRNCCKRISCINEAI